MARAIFSVIIPSARRRSVLAALQGLARQQNAPPFHVVVVLDGPDGDLAAAITEPAYPFETMVLEQSRRGLDRARDLGASAGSGDYLLFIDEDTVAGEDLLAALQARHREGADVVQAGVTVHPAATRTAVRAFLERWTDIRHRRLAAEGMEPPDICISPLSMTHRTYEAMRERIGPLGFADPGMMEDFRIGQCLNALGQRAHYLTDTTCAVLVGETVGHLLGRSRSLGRADAELAAEAPGLATSIAAARAVRWATSGREAKLVRASPEKAERTAGRIQTELMADARRGEAGDDALERLDRAVSLHYWLGYGAQDDPARRIL